MDTNHASMNGGVTFLTECVSDEMSACEAAEATHDCWTQAEEALAPVIGLEGLGVLSRNGEAVALRNVEPPRVGELPVAPVSFWDWVKGLEPSQALAACKAFLLSVERNLVSLVGAARLRRLLRRARPPRR